MSAYEDRRCPWCDVKAEIGLHPWWRCPCGAVMYWSNGLETWFKVGPLNGRLTHPGELKSA